MRRLVFIFVLAMGCLNAAVVIDRLAVVAGKYAIKTSDIERDTRVTAFLNKTAVDLSPSARCKSAERLVDQSMIREEIVTGDYDRATDADAAKMLQQIRRDRFGNSEARLHEELTRYGLTEDELTDALRWRLTVLRFIEERFRPAVLVTDGEPEEQVEQAVDKLFDAWLAEKRTESRVVFRQEAFQ